MKNLWHVLLTVLISSSFSIGQTTEVEETSSIESVTVFLNGAQINRSGTARLKKGSNILRFTDLSQYIINKSIQVEGQEGVTIVSVSHENNYMKNTDEPAHVKVKRKELASILDKKSLNTDKSNVYQAEKEMILANSDISGIENGVDPIELLDIADYYRQRLNKIDFSLLALEKERKDYQKQINNLRKQIKELGYTLNRPTGEVIVKLSSSSAKEVKIKFSYMVTQAGWEPLYDIRSEELTGPIELTYKGNVFQNTGKSWDKVKLTLSTGNPSISGTKPEFVAWYLSTYEPGKNKGRAKSGYGKKSKSSTLAYDSYGGGEATESSADFTTVKESSVNTEFQISLPYTIPSDGKKLAVEVQKHNLPVDYTYFAAPKLDPDAFLMSRISGWDELYLLSGETNIYYQGTYVGSSYIDTETADDTLSISLGRDNNIVVNRKKNKDLCSSSTFGSNKKHDKAIDISVKNTRKTTIKIKIQDHIPVSSNKEIDVELVSSGGGILDEDTGIITWEFILAAGESKETQFRYTVKHSNSVYIPNL